MYYNYVINYPWANTEKDFEKIWQSTVVTNNPNLRSETKKIIYLEPEHYKIIKELPESFINWGNCVLYGDIKLFISGLEGSRQAEFIRFFKIRRVINLSQMKAVTRGMDIDINDFPDENIAQYFNKCNDYINHHKCVLVYCMAGISRSASICIAYLMSTGMVYEAALTHLRKCRPIVNPNEGFTKQLKKYRPPTWKN